MVRHSPLFSIDINIFQKNDPYNFYCMYSYNSKFSLTFGSCWRPGKALAVRFFALRTQLVYFRKGSGPGSACSTLMGGPRGSLTFPTRITYFLGVVRVGKVSDPLGPPMSVLQALPGRHSNPKHTNWVANARSSELYTRKSDINMLFLALLQYNCNLPYW